MDIWQSSHDVIMRNVKYTFYTQSENKYTTRFSSVNITGNIHSTFLGKVFNHLRHKILDEI